MKNTRYTGMIEKMLFFLLKQIICLSAKAVMFLKPHHGLPSTYPQTHTRAHTQTHEEAFVDLVLAQYEHTPQSTTVAHHNPGTYTHVHRWSKVVIVGHREMLLHHSHAVYTHSLLLSDAHTQGVLW